MPAESLTFHTLPHLIPTMAIGEHSFLYSPILQKCKRRPEGMYKLPKVTHQWAAGTRFLPNLPDCGVPESTSMFGIHYLYQEANEWRGSYRHWHSKPFVTSFYDICHRVLSCCPTSSPTLPLHKLFKSEGVLSVFSLCHKFLVSQAQFKCHQYNEPCPTSPYQNLKVFLFLCDCPKAPCASLMHSTL